MNARELFESCPVYNPTFNSISRLNANPVRDLVFVWQKPIVEKVGSIFIPEISQKWFQAEVGVVVAVGKGYLDERKFNPTTLIPGLVVIFEKRVPWRINVCHNNVMHELWIMGEPDVKLILDEEMQVDNIGELFEIVKVQIPRKKKNNDV
jgi:co-chaperonin GroES (HSP10)